MHRIHIVGCGPRSGTTLISEMMIACFEIDLYADHENRIYTWPSRQANIFLTKAPKDILVIEPVLRIMRNLHVIYMLRDPRDMIVSRHGADPERYWASLKYWMAYTPHARRLQSHSRFIMVRYEDLVAEPDAVQAYLMERMPFLVKRGPFSRYHEMARPSEAAMKALGGVRPVSWVSVGNWRKHLPRVVGQLQKHGSITEDLIAYGYERDDTWEHELEGVEPDLEASHWPEHFSEEVLRRQRRGRYLLAIWVMLVHTRGGLLLGRVCRTIYEKSPLLSKLFSNVEEQGLSTQGVSTKTE